MSQYRKWVLLFAFSLTALFSNAQSVLQGIVKDKRTGETLPGAAIFLAKSGLGTITNSEGFFLLKNIPQGNQSISVTYLGYNPVDTVLNFESGKTIVFNFDLDVSGISIDDAVITAQAKGQYEAINSQLNAREIKNVVSSDKIQDIPDANAAESIGRLPGVSVTRSGGEANKVVIRGMDPRFSKINIAGIEMASTDNNNRSADISMISPYSLDGIEVIKAITPDMDADAVGGAVNLKLKKAARGLHGNFVLQTGYNGLLNKFGDYLASGSLGNRFFNNKLGVFGQVNYEQRDRSEINEAHGWAPLPEYNYPDSAPVYHVSDSRNFQERLKKRIGGSLIIDAKWKGGSLLISNFYSQSTTQTTSESQGVNGPARTHGRGGSTNLQNIGVLNNGIQFKQNIKKFSVEALLSHSYSKGEKPYGYSWGFQTRTGSFPLPDSLHSERDVGINEWFGYLNEDADENKVLHTLNFSGNYNIEQIFSGKVDLNYDFFINKNISGSIKAGGKYLKRTREFNSISSSDEISLSSQIKIRQLVRQYLPEEIGELTSENVEFFDYYLFANPDGTINEDLMKEVASIALFHDGVYDDTASISDEPTKAQLVDTYHLANSIRNDYEGQEELYAGYIMAEININKYFTLIPGIRYEENRTNYRGLTADGTGILKWNYNHTFVWEERKNANWLPMVHARLKPVDFFDVRYAYTTTLARPNYRKIIPFWEFKENSMGYHNTSIKPSVSRNHDLYFSFHTNKLGLFTIGGFHKKIEGLIEGNKTVYIQDTSFVPEPDAYWEFGVDEEHIGKKVSYSLNNRYPATIKGVEIEWQTNLFWLPGPLKGLVFNTNYTYTWSQTKRPYTIFDVEYRKVEGMPDWWPLEEVLVPKDTFDVKSLNQQPAHIVNFTIGYDLGAFSARLSMLYQSDVLTGHSRFPWKEQYKDSFLRFDLLAKVDMGFWAKGLEVYGNFNNITGEKDVKFRRGINEPRLTSSHNYGFTMDMGIRYKF